MLQLVSTPMQTLSVQRVPAQPITLSTAQAAPLTLNTGAAQAQPVMTLTTGPVQTPAENRAAFPTASTYIGWDHRTWVYNRPDTYVGSDERFVREEWLYDIQNRRMVNASIDFTPACERLFLEIITNASDNVNRSRRAGVDPGRIEVLMNNSMISVTNYGLPIPIEIHPVKNVYVPQMIFGDLLTSSNYEGPRHEAGTNGIGAKATNIFSKEFMIIVHDHIRQLKYTQVWRNNMLNRDEPIIEPYPTGPSSVQTVYKMDFERFKYPKPEGDQGGYPPEAFALFARHAVDISFTAKTVVTFNGHEFNMSNIRDYARLYFGDAVDNAIVHYQWPTGTEIVRKKKGYQISKNPAVTPEVELIAIDTPDEGHHVSFVNCMMTRDGGVHVNAAIKAVGDTAVQMINDEMIKALTKRNKGKEIDAKQKRSHTININDVKPHISILLSVKVVDPKFTSQTKTVLASPTPKIIVGDDELRPLHRWRLIDRLYAALDAKQFANLSKTDGKSKRYIKLKKGVDANNAGPGAKGHQCVLYVTEGRSGATYADKMSGLIQGGRDNVGILQMRGKSLNVMEAERSMKARLQLENNSEINELKKMLGLREGVDYTLPENFKQLRYGAVMIMADSDVDGKHITGLILLFFHCRFPSLLARGYVMFYRTPILRVSLGASSHKFYTESEYMIWKNATPDYDRWTHKYYKGLGSSKDTEIRQDFPTNRVVNCFYDEHAPASMRLAFSRKMRDQRKDWIGRWQPVLGVDDIQMQPISWFINHELILFSIADVQRSIPKLMDGLKESLRKIVHGAHLKWKIGKRDKVYSECKVAQFGAFVADKSKYHHGELILDDVVVGMAQDFVGANNIPWFTQEGQMGSRRRGGKDAAETRYTFTKPTPLVSYILRKEDQPILKHLKDEGEPVEPEFYLPIIPMALVNGAHGIGTGFSTTIPNHNPLDLVNWLRLKLSGVEDNDLPVLVPWYRGFTGPIKVFDRRNKKRRGKVNVTIISQLDDNGIPTPHVQELEGDDEPEANEALTEEEEEEIYEGREAPESRPLISMTSYGKFHMNLDGTIVITELPIGRWSLPYRKWLEDLVEKKQITGYKDDCRDLEGDCRIYFEIYGFKETPNHRTLKLQKTIGMSNMVLLDENGRPIRYDTSNDVAEGFYYRRLPFYQKRKDYILEKLTEEVNHLNDRIRFIRAVAVEQILEIRNRPEVNIYEDMDRLNLPHYLLDKVKGRQLSADRIAQLESEVTSKITERETIFNTTPAQMWLQDLEDFENAYRKAYGIKKQALALAVAGTTDAKIELPVGTYTRTRQRRQPAQPVVLNLALERTSPTEGIRQLIIGNPSGSSPPPLTLSLS